MKRIAIFCDGTWNRNDKDLLDAEGRDMTNVAHMFNAIKNVPASADGHRQIAHYVDGVGTPDQAGFLGKLKYTSDKFGGGAFGWGLDEKILNAYSFLIENYDPGDQIFLFGFSRGSYTARSLVGLLRNCGLPKLTDGDPSRFHALENPASPFRNLTRDQFFQHLMAVYRSRKSTDVDAQIMGDEPDSDRAKRLREWVNPEIITHRDDHIGHPKADSCTYIRIEYIGVFDTVKALGLPELNKNLAEWNHRYQFHDAALSSMVRAARHAIAIDEPRITYKSVPWAAESVNWLNGRPESGGQATVLQKWFPGVHGTVGGALAGDARGLGNATMEWMVEGAEARGLTFDTDLLAVYRAPVDAMGPFVMPGASYKFPDNLTNAVYDYTRPDVSDPDLLSPTVHARWHGKNPDDAGAYRPKSLMKLAKASGWAGPFRAAKRGFWDRFRM